MRNAGSVWQSWAIDFLRGRAAFYQWTRDANDEAQVQFYRAIGRDPEFASAYGIAGWCYVWRKTNR